MIIDNPQQLVQLQGRSVFLYPVLQDPRLHDVARRVIAFVCIDVDTKQTFTISNGHPDGIWHSDNLDFLSNCKVYCFNTILMKYAGYGVDSYIDTQVQYYLKTNKACIFDTPTIIQHYTRHYENCNMIGSLVSLYKHESIALELFNNIFVQEDQPGLPFYQQKLLPVFYEIEKNGIKVNEDLFDERFGKTFSKHNGFSYSQYNFYTTTGRPSNRFDGINFAALNKENGTRDCFVSRYSDGVLIEVDFNAYHPRLIANLIGYDFGQEDVYAHLAKHYYNTPTPTRDQIATAKEGTFRQIYGGINKQYLHVPFFKAVNELAYQLWNYATQHGYIQSPISGRKLILDNYQDITLYTLFNYFIQMYETETNVEVLSSIHKLLQGKQTKPVLYTYDSILFDAPAQEVDYLLEVVLRSSIDQVAFPFKIKQGSDYQNLQAINK